MVFADGVEVTSSLFCVAVTELPELIVHVAPVHPGPDTLGAAGVMKPARATLTPEARKTIQRIAINLAARIVDSFLLGLLGFPPAHPLGDVAACYTRMERASLLTTRNRTVTNSSPDVKDGQVSSFPTGCGPPFATAKKLRPADVA